MSYKVDYAEAEKVGCSSRIAIENKIFYVKLFESPAEKTRYAAADQKGVITKEISETEFYFWLKTLTDKKTDMENIKQQLSLGKKFVT